MTIERWVTEHPTTVTASNTLREAANLMHSKKIGALPVVERERLVGVLSERDLVRYLSEATNCTGNEPVSQFMTHEPVVARADDDYNTVYMLMKMHNIRHIPIVSGETLTGIVSIRDLAHYYQNSLETEYSEAREQIENLKKLVDITAEEVLDRLFSEINSYRELSLTDHLTGLYNKRYFAKRLAEETSRAKRYRQDLSLIFCDIDHFKKINDNYGHGAGDEVLRQVGGLLAGGMGDLKVVSRLRKSDIIARYGGEEFVVILPETSPENARFAAEKMRAAIENHDFEIDGEHLSVTASFGIGGVDDSVLSTDDLIDRADHAMYRAKDGGRNRVEIFEPSSNGSIRSILSQKASE